MNVSVFDIQFRLFWQGKNYQITFLFWASSLKVGFKFYLEVDNQRINPTLFSYYHHKKWVIQAYKKEVVK